MKSKTKVRSLSKSMKIRTDVRAGVMNNPIYEGRGTEGSNPLF